MSDILNDIFDSVIYSKEDTQDIEKNLEADYLCKNNDLAIGNFVYHAVSKGRSH